MRLAGVAGAKACRSVWDAVIDRVLLLLYHALSQKLVSPRALQQRREFLSCCASRVALVKKRISHSRRLHSLGLRSAISKTAHLVPQVLGRVLGRRCKGLRDREVEFSGMAKGCCVDSLVSISFDLVAFHGVQLNESCSYLLSVVSLACRMSMSNNSACCLF